MELVPPEEQEALQDLDVPVPITVTLVLKSSANGRVSILPHCLNYMLITAKYLRLLYLSFFCVWKFNCFEFVAGSLVYRLPSLKFAV